MSNLIHIACLKKIDPKHQSKGLSNDLKIVEHPLIKYTYLCNDLILKTLNKNIPFVFTSANAIQAVVDCAKKNDVNIQEKIVYSIKGKTSKLVCKSGFLIKTTAKNGTELANGIVENKESEVIHFTANMRRHELQQILLENKVKYEVCEVYHKEKNAVAVPYFEGVMFFSPSQVDIFKEMNSLKPEIPAFCIGKTTANHLKQVGHENILIAEKSSVDSVLDLVYKYFKITK